MSPETLKPCPFCGDAKPKTEFFRGKAMSYNIRTIPSNRPLPDAPGLGGPPDYPDLPTCPICCEADAVMVDDCDGETVSWRARPCARCAEGCECCGEEDRQKFRHTPTADMPCAWVCRECLDGETHS